MDCSIKFTFNFKDHRLELLCFSFPEDVYLGKQSRLVSPVNKVFKTHWDGKTPRVVQYLASCFLYAEFILYKMQENVYLLRIINPTLHNCTAFNNFSLGI